MVVCRAKGYHRAMEEAIDAISEFDYCFVVFARSQRGHVGEDLIHGVLYVALSGLMTPTTLRVTQSSNHE